MIRVLGEGGFGKVLEAKHRISEHNYAIKVADSILNPVVARWLKAITRLPVHI